MPLDGTKLLSYLSGVKHRSRNSLVNHWDKRYTQSYFEKIDILTSDISKNYFSAIFVSKIIVFIKSLVQYLCKLANLWLKIFH